MTPLILKNGNYALENSSLVKWRHSGVGSCLQIAAGQSVDIFEEILQADAKPSHLTLSLGIDSTVRWVRFQNLPESQNHEGHLQIETAEKTKFSFLNLGIGAQDSKFSIEANLNGAGAQVKLFSGSILNHKQSSRQKTLLRLHNENIECEQKIKNIVTDQSKIHFQGLIHLLKQSQKSRVSQISQSMSLSDDARVTTEPQLMIEADDVKASHGATMGQLQPDEVFYLQSRGINAQTAKQILLKGFVHDLFQDFNFFNANLILKKLSEVIA